jgi:hypothetical protein
MSEAIQRIGSMVTLSAPLMAGTERNDLEQTPPRPIRPMSPARSIESWLPRQLKDMAISVRTWLANQKGASALSSPLFKVALSATTIIAIPVACYGNIPVSTFLAFLQFIKTCWDCLLHVNAYHVGAVTLPFAFYFAHQGGTLPSKQSDHRLGFDVFDPSSHPSLPARKMSDYDPTNDLNSAPVRKVSDYDLVVAAAPPSNFAPPVRKVSDYDPLTDPDFTHNNESILSKILGPDKICSVICTPRVVPAFVILFFCIGIVVTSQLHLVAPSIAWMPFAWGTYKVYLPYQLPRALEGLCLKEDQQALHKQPLCLPESSWKTLSAGALSSKNRNDVKTVMQGIEYAQTSGGIIINVMARDIVHAIDPLRRNVEALSRFFPNLAVVVFENDSVDGSRETFLDWGNAAQGYTVDVMQCDEAPDCKFGETHRYEEGFESMDYFKKSAVGSMVRFRQRMNDYILAAPEYKDYSHMMVMDMDLGISLSPLGVLHSLGKAPDNSVVSSGRTLWPGSLGSLAVPYDFSAFRPYVTETNQHVVDIHRNVFCALMPKGDKWRNQCDAISSMQMMEVLAGDRSGDELYRVDSAFNGAVLYPLKDLRESGTKYDSGDDSQRCEHIGFNLGLQNTMYVNPKWDMHLNPSHPGGPSGPRAMKQVYRISVVPQLGIVIFIQNVGSMVAFVYSMMTLGMHVLYPLCLRSAVNACASRRRTQRDQLPLRRVPV